MDVSASTTATQAAKGFVLVSYSMFQVFGEWDDGPGEEEDTPSDEEIMIAVPPGIAIASAASDHEADVQLEVWEQEPPAQAVGTDGWEVTRELVTRLGQGPWMPTVVAEGPVEDFEVIVPVAGDYKVRLYSAGRDLVVAARDRAIGDLTEDSDLEIPEGVERYLIQAWPV